MAWLYALPLKTSLLSRHSSAQYKLMFHLGSEHRYFLYRNPCDMRKSFDGLCGVVSNELHRNPLNGEVFIFLNKAGTHIKLLHWEEGGFVLYYKRMEKGTISIPKLSESGCILYHDLVLMIAGIEVLKSKQKKRYKIGWKYWYY